MKSTRVFFTISIVVFLLLIPLVAMQFTNEVNWSPFDFLVMAALLLSTGLGIDYIFRKAKTKRIRVALSLSLITLLLLVWGELAVGIFGSPIAGS